MDENGREIVMGRNKGVDLEIQRTEWSRQGMMKMEDKGGCGGKRNEIGKRVWTWKFREEAIHRKYPFVPRIGQWKQKAYNG